jgi:hypothetical protein
VRWVEAPRVYGRRIYAWWIYAWWIYKRRTNLGRRWASAGASPCCHWPGINRATLPKPEAWDALSLLWDSGLSELADFRQEPMAVRAELRSVLLEALQDDHVALPEEFLAEAGRVRRAGPISWGKLLARVMIR